MNKIQIRFDGPPEHEAGRFVEVEDDTGASISIGEWVQDGDYWLLVIDDPRPLRARIVTLESQLEQARALLWVWTDMDPLRYDNEYSACPFCAFDYPNMRHESDCAFVQARVFLGIEGGGSDADS